MVSGAGCMQIAWRRGSSGHTIEPKLEVTVILHVSAVQKIWVVVLQLDLSDMARVGVA